MDGWELKQNNYVYELPEHLWGVLSNRDLEYVYNAVITRKNAPNVYAHASEFKELMDVFHAFPFLSGRVSFFELQPTVPWPIHTDHSSFGTTDRLCALNVCVGGPTEASTAVTKFWYVDQDRYTDDLKHKIRTYSYKSAKELFAFNMQGPCLINTQVPHSVFGTGIRRLISFSCGMPFGEVVAALNHISEARKPV